MYPARTPSPRPPETHKLGKERQDAPSMHPRNPWAGAPPDFKALASKYPRFAPYVKSGRQAEARASIDFRDASALRTLTEILLEDEFGLTVHLPDNRLCPSIPNRVNYILWLQDILSASWRPQSLVRGRPEPLCPLPETRGEVFPEGKVEEEPARKRARKHANKAGTSMAEPDVRFLDIGTGSIAVYALLGCALDPRWRFVGTEVDSDSLLNAQSIIKDERNRILWRGSQTICPLSDRITLVARRADEALVPEEGVTSGAEADPLFHITMCNPPFYETEEDMRNSAEGKAQKPNATCDGAPVEMITPGGEVGFVRRMVRQSRTLGTRVVWYTSMLGRLSSVAELVSHLRAQSIDNYTLTEFVQGRTKRWGLGWTHTPYRLPDDVCRSSASLAKLQPISNERVRRLRRGRFGKRGGTDGRGGNTEADGNDVDEAAKAIFAKLESAGMCARFMSSTETAATRETSPDDEGGGAARGARMMVRCERDTWSRAARRKAAQAAKQQQQQQQQQPSPDSVVARQGAACEETPVPTQACTEPLLCLDIELWETREGENSSLGKGAAGSQDHDAQASIATTSERRGKADETGSDSTARAKVKADHDAEPLEGEDKSDGRGGERAVWVALRWTYGRDRKAFESLAGWLNSFFDADATKGSKGGSEVGGTWWTKQGDPSGRSCRDGGEEWERGRD